MHGKGTGFVNVVAWHISSACGPMGLRVSIIIMILTFLAPNDESVWDFHNEII